MRKASSLKLWNRILVVALGVHALAFTVPQKDDLVELSAFLNGREKAMFRKSDDNVLMTFAPGTRAEVKEVKRFETGNYGICLQILNSKSNQNCTWVYYNKKQPNMKLYAVAGKPSERAAKLAEWNAPQMKTQETQSPERANAVETLRTVTGIQEAIVNTTAVVSTAIAKAPADVENLLKGTLQNFAQMNRNQSETLAPKVECTDCNRDNLAYAQCTENNNYLQNTLGTLIQDPDLAAVLQSPVRQVIRPACVQRSLDAFPNMRGTFKTCDAGRSEPNRSVNKACTSQEYVSITAKSFNAVADCMADYVSGNESTKNETALEIFSLMAHESGLQANAVSPTGAGGAGQLTQDAIEDVNRNRRSILSHLSKKSNPICSQNMVNMLNQPLDGRKRKSCERIELGKDNPIKNMLYSFAFQGINRNYFEDTIFQSATFDSVISTSLPALERERLMSSITAWSHNTGRGGMQKPLRAQMASYLRNGKVVRTAQDVDKFLRDLRSFMTSHSYYNTQLNRPSLSASQRSRIKRRIDETATYFQDIQTRVSAIAEEPRTCLAN